MHPPRNEPVLEKRADVEESARRALCPCLHQLARATRLPAREYPPSSSGRGAVRHVGSDYRLQPAVFVSRHPRELPPSSQSTWSAFPCARAALCMLPGGTALV